LTVQHIQLEREIVGTAHSEGQIAPAAFARRLLHDLDDVHAAISDLVDRGLVVPAEGDTFRLTASGEAFHRAREKAHRAAVVGRTQTWQRG
jgi:Mn-dependent DtxR family transcriptional regulator